jgi:hypothetical protein
MSECDKFQSVAIEIDKHKREKASRGNTNRREKTSRRKTYKKRRMITNYQFEQKMLKIKKETNIESLN